MRFGFCYEYWLLRILDYDVYEFLVRDINGGVISNFDGVYFMRL